MGCGCPIIKYIFKTSTVSTRAFVGKARSQGSALIPSISMVPLPRTKVSAVYQKMADKKTNTLRRLRNVYCGRVSRAVDQKTCSWQKTTHTRTHQPPHPPDLQREPPLDPQTKAFSAQKSLRGPRRSNPTNQRNTNRTRYIANHVPQEMPTTNGTVLAVF